MGDSFHRFALSLPKEGGMELANIMENIINQDLPRLTTSEISAPERTSVPLRML